MMMRKIPFCLTCGLLAIFFVNSCRSSDILLYPVEVQSLYGYIDREGKLIIAPKYPNVLYYQEGFAPVQRKNGIPVYLNLEGEELEIPTDYGTIEKLDSFSDGMARVVVDKQVGYVNTKLAWAIQPQFDRAGRFSEGFAAVLDIDQRSVVYMNKKGEEVFVLNNVTAAGPMRAGFAYFIRDGLFGMVNHRGQIIRKPSYLFLASADPISGLARAQDSQTELFGFVDRSGSWVIPPRYPNAGDFSEGFASVYIRNENRYGYIDARGKLRLQGRYLAAGEFHDGLAWVRTEKGFRYIDQDGKWLSPLIFTYAHSFYEGLAAAFQGDNQLYIDTEGRVAWPVSNFEN